MKGEEVKRGKVKRGKGKGEEGKGKKRLNLLANSTFFIIPNSPLLLDP